MWKNKLSLAKKIIFFSSIFILASCLPIETKDAEKAYKYWSGGRPPKESELIKGAYYQSPHFSLKYELFLKFRADKKWFHEFVKYNKLEIDTVGNDWAKWTKLPGWFKIDENYLIYTKDQTNEFERSRY